MKNNDIYRQGFIFDENDMEIQWRFMGMLNKVIKGARADYFNAAAEQKNREVPIDTLALGTREDWSAADRLEAVLDHLMVREAIRRLPSNQRHVIVQYYFYGKTEQLIAAEMGLSRQRVQAIKGQALKRLKVFLREVM